VVRGGEGIQLVNGTVELEIEQIGTEQCVLLKKRKERCGCCLIYRVLAWCTKRYILFESHEKHSYFNLHDIMQ